MWSGTRQWRWLSLMRTISMWGTMMEMELRGNLWVVGSYKLKGWGFQGEIFNLHSTMTTGKILLLSRLPIPSKISTLCLCSSSRVSSWTCWKNTNSCQKQDPTYTSPRTKPAPAPTTKTRCWVLRWPGTILCVWSSNKTEGSRSAWWTKMPAALIFLVTKPMPKSSDCKTAPRGSTC